MKTDTSKLASSRVYIDAVFNGLEPDPILTVTEWAREHRVLSSVSSAEVGRYNPDRTPYGREIMDNLSVDSPYIEIIWVKGAQVGATEIGNNWLGYIVDHVPAPTMMVLPNLDSAKKNSKTRIQPMIDASSRLSQKIKPANTKESGNTVLQKDFPGGTLIIAGANSAVSLRSSPIRNLYLDEEDGYPEDCGGEGNPIKLAKKRTDTFSSKKKIFRTSTPVTEGKSKIEAGFNKTDQRKYFVPCPECGHMQWLQWQQLKWDKGKYETVRYHCEECEHPIENWQKTEMLEQGEWRATSEGTNPKVIGYHLSGLYSPVGWLTWEDIAREWEEINNPLNLEDLQTFINTVLGESWKDKGDAPEWDKIYKRRELYEINSIPDGVCFLVAGVDVQADRIECEIVGYGRHKRSWSIDYRIFEGDTSSIDSPPWLELQDVLAEVWTAPNGVDMEIKRMAIDSGYNTQTVYSWVRQFSIHKVIAIKGSDHQQVTLNQGTLVDIRKKGKVPIRKALKLFTVGVSGLKQELYGWLKQKAPDPEMEPDKLEPYGFCHFPQYAEEHFKRLTSETLETKWVKGKKHYEWVANGRNEQLDCRVYARAAASFFGMDRFKDAKWSAFETEVGVSSARHDDKTVQKLGKKIVKTTLKRRKSQFT